jgi:predicted enzyme related to lactoylglutathione lyase
MTELASIVLFTEHLPETIAFYRALGIDLEDEDHGDGQVHTAGEAGDVHVAVLGGQAGAGTRSPAHRQGGATFAGWWVDSLDDTMAALAALGAERIREHEQVDWGCRCIVTDPDGRAVEINQAGHCPEVG